MLSLEKVILQIYDILWNRKRRRIVSLSLLLARSMKNSFRFSCISFRIILYKYKYCFFYRMILMSEGEEYEVKNILKNKKKWGKFYYFVRWKKFPLCKDNWIFKHYLTNAQNILKRYYKRESFITVMLKTKNFRLWIRKKDFSKKEQSTNGAQAIYRTNIDWSMKTQYRLR